MKAETPAAYAAAAPATLREAERAGVPAPAGADPLAFAEALKRQDPPIAYERLSRRALKDPTIPWPTLLSGVLLVNLFYWCTNQQIIQRTFAADGLKSGQKGVLLAAGFKLLAPVVMVVPGLAALHLYGSDLAGGEVDKGLKAYGTLVGDVLPDGLLGFFAAVVFGAILSTFNSVLNATSTLFSLGVYKAQLRPDATDRETVRAGMLFGGVVAVVAVVGGPLLGGVEGIFAFLQDMRGLYFIPIFAAMLAAFNTRRLPDWAGAAAILGGATVVGIKILRPELGGGREPERAGRRRDAQLALYRLRVRGPDPVPRRGPGSRPGPGEAGPAAVARRSDPLAVGQAGRGAAGPRRARPVRRLPIIRPAVGRRAGWGGGGRRPFPGRCPA